jgi:hypothetical protein
MVDEKESEWQKMAIPLQIQFVQKINEVLDKYEVNFKNMEKGLEEIREQYKNVAQRASENSDWKSWKVVVIDGSNSAVTERNGISVFCISSVGIMVDVRTEKIIDEWYMSDVVTVERDVEDLESYVGLKRMDLERKMIKEACKHKPDLIIIDGPFFPSMKIIAVGEDTKELEDIQLNTLEAKNNNIPIISIVKRSVSKFFYYKAKLEGNLIPNITDKLLMTVILSPKTFGYLDKISTMWKYAYRGDFPIDRGETKATSWLNTKWRQFDKDFINSFDTPTYFVRSIDTADAFKTEVPDYCKDKLNAILSFLVNWCNPDTGLPYAFDLVDQVSMVPSGFSKEFSEELEAGLIERFDNPERVKLISKFFSPLNPQAVYKEE